MKETKTKAKRILSVLLALVIVISAVPLSSISVFAETSEDFEYEILEDGTAEITGYNGTASNLVIPSQIDGYKVTSIGMNAFLSNISLANITIPEGITKIGHAAFFHCKNIKNVTIPNSIEHIDNIAFALCTSLKTVNLPAKLSFIARDTFDGCTNLTEINVAPNNVYYSSKDGVLFNKEKTELHIFPKGKSESNYVIPNSVITIADKTFSDCTKLTGITIPNSVTYLGDYSFSGCTNLININIPNSVTTIGYNAFNYCVNLKSVTISNSVTSIEGYAFSGCENLTDISLPNKITKISNNIFEGCKSLENIVIPDSVETIVYSAFKNCSNLTSITIPNSVTFIYPSVFVGCTNLSEINVANDNQSYSSLDGILFNKDQTKIIRFPEGKTNKNYIIPFSVTNIGNSAFENCIFLTNITIPNSVTNIGDGAFNYCTSLRDVFIPDSVTVLGFMSSIIFEGCNSIKLYGYAGTAAETYAKENGFEFITLDKKTDETTGISVAEKELNILPDGAQLRAEQLSAEDNKIVFDISLVKDDIDIQPNGEVTVKIPVPEGMDTSLCKVYREETDGTFTNMNAYYANGYMVFTTDHFSKYILSTEEMVYVLKGDVNEDGITDAADAVLVQRYDAGLVTLNNSQLKTADVNSDGITDAADAVIIMRYDAGLIPQL